MKCESQQQVISIENTDPQIESSTSYKRKYVSNIDSYYSESDTQIDKKRKTYDSEISNISSDDSENTKIIKSKNKKEGKKC